MRSPAILEKKVTFRDYASWPEDGKRYEIIGGESFVMAPAPRIIHQRVVRNAALLLRDRLKAKGEVLLSPCDVVLDQHNVVQPDVLFVSRERRKIVTEDNVQGAPDLVVEVLSPATSHRDLLAKRELYEKFGVREYWIVDPQEKTLDILCLHGGAFRRAAKSVLAPGIQSDHAAFWEGL